MKPNLVSLIMPVYNAERFLEETILSILNQTYQHWELIAIDDNSSDNSYKILKDFQQKDSRIKVSHFDENKKPAKVRNYGVKMAQGEYIGFIDADDVCFDYRLKEQVDYLNTHSEISIVGGDYIRFGAQIDEEKAFLLYELETIKLGFIYENFIGNSTVLGRQSVLKEYQFNETFVPMEDYELWTRIVLNHQLINLKIPLVKYRIHTTNITSNSNVDYKKMQNKVQLNYLANIGYIINEQQFLYLKKALFITQRATFEEVQLMIDAFEDFQKFNETAKFFCNDYISDLKKKNFDFYFFKLKKNKLIYFINTLQYNKPIFKHLTLKTKFKFLLKSILHL